MTFVEKLKALASKKNLTAKVKDGTMTEADWKEFADAYKQEYGTDLYADQAAHQTMEAAAKERNEIAALFNVPESGSSAPAASQSNPVQPTQPADPAASQSSPSQPAQPVDPAASQNPTQPVQSASPEASQAPAQNVVEQVRALITQNQTQAQQIATMQNRATPDIPAGNVSVQITPNGPGTTSSHLFGIENPIFSMDTRWNKIASNPKLKATLEDPTPEEEKSFQAEASQFGIKLKNRYQTLMSEHKLNPTVLNAEFSTNTSDLSAAGLGDQYLVRRMDALIARIITLDEVGSLFQTRYGIIDRELITNAIFTEVTQAFQKGNVFKGSMKLQPDLGYVDDIMIKVEFGSMKEIERLYIGYLNTNGSDPIKWGMIEFALLNLMKAAVNEYNVRKIMGIGVKPEAGVAGAALTSSTGVLYTLIRLFHENKINPHYDAAYATYDNLTFYDAVKAFKDDVLESLNAFDLDLKGKAIYLNKAHRPWWLTNMRTEFGKDMDFTGPQGYANIIPDTEIPIIWVPNMGNTKFMWFDIPGNIQFLENVPGELYAIKIKEDMEEVKAYSYAKEGTSAAYSGIKFSTKALMEANNYELQQIFMTKPITLLAADATTISGITNFWFGSIANAAATAITDITSAKKGRAYIIECTNLTNASTIAKAGKFATLTAAWTPTAVGDYIMVIINEAGTGFLELERCVAGVRTINTAIQPNVPGAR